MALRIHFDSQAFAMQQYGGISRYVVELATALAAMPGVVPQVIAPLHINRLLQQSDVARVGPSWLAQRLPARLRRPLNEALDDFLASVMPADVLHQTYYRRGRSPRRGVPMVTTVHDMIHEKFPDAVHPADRSAEWKHRAVRGSDAVICISNCTRDDLCEILGLPRERVSVVHHGVRRVDPATIEPVKLPRPYVLYVGSRSRYKNFSMVLRAFAADRRIASECMLVAFGDRPFSQEELALAADLGIDDTTLVRIEGDDALLDRLYGGAVCLVYPSLYEGFGMPLLEAMAAQCPVVAARSSSLPEVAGSAAEFFEPDRLGSLVQALNAVIYDTQRSRELARAGAERASAFTWQRAAEQTLAVYRSIA